VRRRRSPLAAALAASLWLLGGTAPAVAQDPATPVEPTAPTVPTDTVERAIRSVGIVSSGMRMGTGWMAGDGVVVTNFHVSRASSADVTFTPSDGTRVVCFVAAADRRADLSALRCPETGRPVLPIAERAAVLGEPVTVVGYPGGVGPTVTTGVVSELDREISTVRTLGFTAAIEPGSSGSPVVAADGTVIAVATFGGGYGSKADKLREIVARAEGAASTRGRQTVRNWFLLAGPAGAVFAAIGGYTGWRSGTGRGRRRAGWSAVVGVLLATMWIVLQTLIDGPTQMVT